jgi:hypothetical protein
MSEGAFEVRRLSLMTVSAIRVGVFVVREGDTKIRDEVAGLCSCEESFTKTRKRIASGLARRNFRMAIGTDPWRGSLARKELLPVTSEARFMFRIFSRIRKRVIRLARLLPILGWKRMAGVASCAVLFSKVRKACVIDPGFTRWRRSASLRRCEHVQSD